MAAVVGSMVEAGAGPLARRLHRKYSTDLGIWSYSNLRGLQANQKGMLDNNPVRRLTMRSSLWHIHQWLQNKGRDSQGSWYFLQPWGLGEPPVTPHTWATSYLQWAEVEGGWMRHRAFLLMRDGALNKKPKADWEFIFLLLHGGGSFMKETKSI